MIVGRFLGAVVGVFRRIAPPAALPTPRRSDPATEQPYLIAAAPQPVRLVETEQQVEDRDRLKVFDTLRQVDECVAGKSSQEIVAFALSLLSHAQTLFCLKKYPDGEFERALADRHANHVRHLIEAAKYAITKAVP